MTTWNRGTAMTSKKLREWKHIDLWRDNHEENQINLDVDIYRNKQGVFIIACVNMQHIIIDTLLSLEIAPEPINPENKICDVGRGDNSGRWYCWGVCGGVGFAIGEKIYDPKWKGDGGDISGVLFTQRGDKTITTEAEARMAAANLSGLLAVLSYPIQSVSFLI